MLMYLDSEFLNVKSKPGVKDPSKTYYSVNLFDGDDICNLNCSSECAAKLSVLPPKEMYSFTVEYNPGFNTLRILDVCEVSTIE